MSGDGCRQADCHSGLVRRRNFSLSQRCRCAGPTARVLTGRAAVSQSLESLGLERHPKVVIGEPSFDVVSQRWPATETAKSCSHPVISECRHSLVYGDGFPFARSGALSGPGALQIAALCNLRIFRLLDCWLLGFAVCAVRRLRVFVGIRRIQRLEQGASFESCRQVGEGCHVVVGGGFEGVDVVVAVVAGDDDG